MVQTYPNAGTSSVLNAAVMTRPMPRMENGAADSMSIAAMLVYIFDISGESISRMIARIRRRRKQIIEVTTTFKLTLSVTHGTTRLIGSPVSKDVPGKAYSTNVTTESTEREKKQNREEPEPTTMRRSTI